MVTKVQYLPADGVLTDVETRLRLHDTQIATASGTRTTEQKTASAGQTVFTLSNAYIPGTNTLQVYVNGLLTTGGTDYTETSSTTVTFTTGMSVGDELQFVAFGNNIGTVQSQNASFMPAGTGAVVTTVQNKLRESPSVVDQGADPAGTANSTASFAKARAITNRYYIPTGTYILDASPDPFLDCFTSGSGVTLVVGGVSYDCSNAFAGPLRYVAASATKTNIVHAKTGNVIQYWQDGAPGTATGFYRGLAFTTDSHFAQAQPATNGGSTDLLFQRSTVNTTGVFTASVSGGSLTISAVISGSLSIGSKITGGTLSTDVFVTGFISGTMGGVGVYSISGNSTTQGPITVTASDPAGNRFNITFEETGDRLLFSFATTGAGAPTFDTAWAINAGTGATMTFPGLQAQFNQGVTVKQRAAGGFVAGLIPTSSTVASLQQVGGSSTNYMNFRDGAFGFFGSSGTSQQTITGSRGSGAALASLLTALAATGLIVDSTTS